MRRLEFDQFEFPNPSTEERLVITLEAKSIGDDPRRFLARCDNGSELVKQFAALEMSAFAGSFGSKDIGHHLRTFANVGDAETGSATHCRFDFGPDEQTVFLETSLRHVLYHRSTSG